jgi:hypothetical protein
VTLTVIGKHVPENMGYFVLITYQSMSNILKGAALDSDKRTLTVDQHAYFRVAR